MNSRYGDVDSIIHRFPWQSAVVNQFLCQCDNIICYFQISNTLQFFNPLLNRIRVASPCLI